MGKVYPFPDSYYQVLIVPVLFFVRRMFFSKNDMKMQCT
jgi:hypothetical protein